MASIIVFDKQTLEILRCVTCPTGQEAAQCGAGESWIHGAADDAAQYVDLSRWPFIHDKPHVAFTLSAAQIAADGNDVATLTAEAGATAEVDGQRFELLEPLELSADMPGTITVVLRHPLRLETIATIEAVLP